MSGKLLFPTILSLMVLLGCQSREAHTIAPAEASPSETELPSSPEFPEINLLEVGLPLELEKIDLSGPKKAAPEEERKAIQKLLSDYYVEDCGGDSSETYFRLRDCYVATLALREAPHRLRYVLLEHQPDGKLNGKLLFFDRATKQQIGPAIDHNVHAMYAWEEGKLVPSELKRKLGVGDPEISLLDHNEDGTADFKLRRLYHNGTANAIETLIIDLSSGVADTLEFRRIWLN